MLVTEIGNRLAHPGEVTYRDWAARSPPELNQELAVDRVPDNRL